ncbi:neurofilament heavy polypeptide-like isoform X1 [Diorhabda carinulata]|uniref:neurofilament heavy polypeptide-like isoform X1 n=1 Tax=Diorhabda carinulata TaxID=1163345 RepID=UPI0025A23957|nr:neurofilament heavy polypeptide-like isoform X1 [Diorhabda carinulata]XP_057664234.1 neurofilament heavy polypeptide-like isoform X1 [Diorhabda carinulata]
MAAIVEMGEVEDIHSKEEGNIIMNGDLSNNVDMENQVSQDSVKKSAVPLEPIDTDDNSDTKEKEETEDSNEDEIEDDDDEEEDREEEIVNNVERIPVENNPSPVGEDEAPMEVHEINESQSEENEVRSEELVDDSSQETKASEEQTEDEEMAEKITEENDKTNDDNSRQVDENSKQSTEGSETSVKKFEEDFVKDKVVEIHEIDSDDDDDEANKIGDPIELNDSGGEDGDVVIVDAPKENGTSEVIDLETPEKKIKEKKPFEAVTPRRSSRNLNKTKSYAESDKEDTDTGKVKKYEKEKMMMMMRGVEERLPMPTTPSTAVAAAAAAAAAASASEESDIEEILPQDPLACNDSITVERIPSDKSKSTIKKTPIVVNDTKRLVEIATKSNCNSNNIPQGTKKEPTLVIIDTNSILSGRGPIPVNKNSAASNANNPISNATSSYQTVLPMALPAQGMYPPNMRATITPIPVNQPPILTAASQSAKLSPATITPAQTNPLLPSLTDDMFVVEAPSFIVPYVYEKPPVKDFKEFVKEIEQQIKEKDKKRDGDGDKKKKQKKDDDEDDDDDSDDDDKTQAVEEHLKKEAKTDPNYVPETKKDLDDAKKPYSYFDSPLGKFFINIGFNLVQEYVQTDLLKQQKRKHSREGGSNPETEKTIKSLVKNLAYSKENNEPFKTPLKKCEFCNFKTESSLAMSYHLETPHMKNFVYKCNFCPYEIRSPHDILFHMEAEHAVRGHLERAPAFHQCPNCPFEDNQKGKLSRHLVTCMKKFKAERNLEPPVDWEPPAKIPRVPKMRQQGLNATAAAYQALSKNTQFQFLSKMQLQSAQNALNRGRGRPTLGGNVNIKPQGALVRPPGMVFKQQTMSGGSVLVPTNYQLSGNQVFQVVGGQDISGRLGNSGHVFVPNVPSASSTSSALQNQSSSKKPAQQPSISITPLPRNTSSSSSTTSVTPVSSGGAKPGDTTSKNSFVICEICDGYIKDLEQLRNHMQWIHKIKIHPKMIYNRPPLNCQKCQFRFFTDQGLERHLLGSHGLVTSSMQDAANKSKDSGRCPVCGRVYQWKLLNHVARDHSMTLKPAHLSYKCTVCTATFGMYKQFENHVYSAHSVVAKRVMDKKGTTTTTANTKSSSGSSADQLKPLKINDEITIIPQPAKSSSANGKEEKSSPGTSKSR